MKVGTRTVKSGTASPESPGLSGEVFGKGTRDARFPGGYANENGREEVEAWECVEGCPVRTLDEQTADVVHGAGAARPASAGTHSGGQGVVGFTYGGPAPRYGDSGGASRFFYTAKASRAERNAGLDGFDEKMPHNNAGHVHADGRAWDVPGSHSTARANHHPTVKPIDLMRWLVRLVTPPGGLVLDPFLGSGTTGIAAHLEGFRFIGVEQDAEYAAIARARIAFWQEHGEDGLRICAEREQAKAKREAIAATGQTSLMDLL